MNKILLQILKLMETQDYIDIQECHGACYDDWWDMRLNYVSLYHSKKYGWVIVDEEGNSYRIDEHDKEWRLVL